VSTILDALRKASEERGHIRSPIARGELYAQTRVQPAMAMPGHGASHGAATAAFAVGALVLTATVFIAVVIWASHTASVHPAPLAAAAPAAMASLPATISPPPAAPASVAVTPAAALQPPAAPGDQPPESRRLVDQYLGSQLLPTVPINVEMDLGPLPPPAPLASARGGSMGGHLPADDGTGDYLSMGAGGSLPLLDDEIPIIEDSASEPAAPARPRWSLEGIVWDEQHPMAIINGAIVGVGDRVEGAQVTEIRQDAAVLDDDGSAVTVTIN
jgi:hypothetical protein